MENLNFSNKKTVIISIIASIALFIIGFAGGYLLNSNTSFGSGFNASVGGVATSVSGSSGGGCTACKNGYILNNGSCIKSNITYGDANVDGKINVTDANLINKYLNKKSKLSTKGLKNADINGDGKVNATDYLLVKAVAAKVYVHDGSVPLVDYAIYGDVNFDGKINVVDANLVNRYLNENYELGTQALKNADINGDGKVDTTDYLLIKAVAAKIYSHEGTTALKDYVIYGDVNSDGKINVVDANLVNRYLNENYELDAQALKNADINGDGKVDTTDYLLIKAVAAKIYSHEGTTALKDYIIYGDVNSDGKINVVDANLVNRYVNSNYELDAQALKNADINGDGKVDMTDHSLIREVSVKMHSHDGTTPLNK